MSSMQVNYTSAEDWLMGRIGEVPSTALGWFRAGVGFYNKKEFNFAIECFQRSIELDPYNVRSLFSWTACVMLDAACCWTSLLMCNMYSVRHSCMAVRFCSTTPIKSKLVLASLSTVSCFVLIFSCSWNPAVIRVSHRLSRRSMQ